jgi:transcriptional regulator with XRE-family HTH domain
MSEDTAYAIGKRLRFIRKAAGLKREDLAAKAEVSRASISYWEHGKVNSPIKSKSLNKLLNAFSEVGLEVTEKWLKEGLGESPRYEGKLLLTNYPEEININNEKLKSDTTIQLASIFSDEIKLFTTIPQTVILKINHSNFLPFIDKGDLVGGIWQSSQLLSEPSLCIIETNGQLDLSYVKKSSKEGALNIYNNYSSINEKSYTTAYLDKLAPIIRLWR